MKRWVEALRSGKYKQGRERLNKNGKFCCLGVLCEILKKELKIEVVMQDGQVRYDGYQSYLPSRVGEYAGMIDYNCCGDIVSLGVSLANLNDGVGGKKHNFKQIADIIEEYHEEL